MSNPYRGEVAIEIGGKRRTLRFDLNALAEIEQALGLRGLDATLAALSNLGYREARAALWAGLKHECPALTLEEVGSWDLLSNKMRGLRDAIDKITEAMAAAFGTEETNRDGEPGEAQAPGE